jgi:cell wall-associated protease
MRKSLLFGLLLFSSASFGARYVVEVNDNFDQSNISSNIKIEKFYPGKIASFSSRYILSTDLKLDEVKSLSWIKNVENTYELTRLSLTHPNEVKRVVKDELFPYQWGLLNQKQTYFLEKDDIHNVPVYGLEGKDIGWEKLLKIKTSERPIVAVLDSGIDLNHPDIKDNLWKNSGECGKDPNRDNDGNQLAGDCDGWNFTEAIDSQAAKIPNDIDGHGTHVAGIIGAANNGIGIVGVAPNSLIMPIKVMRDSGSRSEISSSEAFARGILYAVDNGAHVINMSLGWPRSLETRYLRDAVGYAISKGVVIVAAAGNNNSTEPLFPCAYENVICVAASTLDGNFAGFSNYGSHVDTIAPGEGILSLAPTIFSPDFFSVDGYDVKSGTSQAAPFVAGLIATMKAMNKSISLDEIHARIYQAPVPQSGKKYVLGGESNSSILFKDIDSSVIRPVLKRVRQIVVSLGDDSEIVVPVKNYGLDAEGIDVTVESISPSVKISSDVFHLNELKLGETKNAIFKIQKIDFNGEANVTLKVSIVQNGETATYLNEIPVVRDIKNDPSLKRLTFSFLDKPLPIAQVRNGSIVPTISTVNTYRETGAHEFFMRRTIQDGTQSKLEITLFSKDNEQYVQARNLILIEDAITLVNFIRLDLNFDGKEDYLVQTVSEKDGKKFFSFSFFDSELNPLWNDFQNVALEQDVFIENLTELAFVNFDHPKLGRILVPSFFTMGGIPVIDQTLARGQRPDATRKLRLYYLEPVNSAFRLRTFTTNEWEEKIKEKLKTKWFATVFTEQILNPSEEDRLNGKVRVIISVGLGTQRELYIVTFDATSSAFSPRIPQLVLQTYDIDSVMKVTPTGLKRDGEAFFNVYDRTRAKIVTTKDSVQDGQYIYRHETDMDMVAGHLVTFETDSSKFSVIQSREELVSIKHNDKGAKISSRAKLRYSFLSSRLLSEMYIPVSYKRDNRHRPALYVDSTSVTLNRVYLFEEQNGELVLSIRNSLIIPRDNQLNCRPMNPHFSHQSGNHEFQFLCLENRQWVIRSFEMN